MVEVTFIYSRYGGSADEEDKNSSKAIARSHAAKVAHKKRQSRNLNHQSTTRGTGCTHQFLSNYQGSSDPFNATLAVRVDPRVHQTLMFIQEVFIPTAFAAASHSWVRDFTCESYFKGSATSILNDPQTLGEILPYLTMIAKRTQCRYYQRQALTTHLRIVQKARATLSDAFPDQYHLLHFTKSLFSSAISQRDIDAARCHGYVLGHLLARQLDLIGSSSLADGFVINLLFYTLQLSHITLERSIIDLDWVDRFLQHAARPVIDILEPLHDSVEGILDPCISNRRLRDSYRTMYNTFQLWYHEHQPSPEITRHMLASYCLIQHNANQIRLINHFAYFREELNNAQKMSASRVSYLVSQALLSINLAAFLATFVANPKIGTRYIWDKHIELLSQLRWLLNHRWRGGLVLHEQEFRVYENLLLWVYWVGATWEHREALSPRYFSSRFRNACRTMNLRSWSQVESVLNRFAMAALALPPPEDWVEIELMVAWANHDRDEQGPLSSDIMVDSTFHPRNLTLEYISPSPGATVL
jgi:hypothetical protein